MWLPYTDDHGERTALPLLRHQLPHCCGQRWAPWTGSYGAGLCRHNLWALWVKTKCAHTRSHSHSDVSGVTVLADLCVAPLFCSLEEPCCGGAAGRAQHHPEERDQLSAESHQWSPHHHCPAPPQPPSHQAVRPPWCRARGTRMPLRWRCSA